MQKEQYEALEMEIVVFDTEDVIMTSPYSNSEGQGGFED
jgi:hypothetical protein